jgi:ribosomal protein S18 acetylase RimI-like enzyme
VGVEIRRGAISDVDGLEPLWGAMVEHHRDIAGHTWPVRDGGEAWSRRRKEYLAWLTDGTGTLFVAASGDRSDLVGYAMLRVHAPGATWDLGDVVGEIESLAVARDARGAGVGTDLIAVCRSELRNRSVEYWSVAVVEANEAAVRLYQREGFRAYYRNLLGRVDSAG